MSDLIKIPWLKWTVFSLVFLLVWLFLANFSNKHHPTEIFDYRSEITADKGGYYVYFPATFIYGYQADKFPKGIDVQLGGGFQLDTVTNKVVTKYSSGVAILTTPFFLATHAYQKLTGAPATGFTEPYFKTANYAGVFYFLIGIVFLYFYLINFYKSLSVVIALIVTVCITNLFYYSLIDTLMSHVYTFSLMSMLLWSMNKYVESNKLKYVIIVSVLVSLIVLIRPINLLFVVPLFLLNLDSWESVKQRLGLYFKVKNVAILVAVILLIFLPQLIYYNYLSGNFFMYTYKNEGFSNLFSPKFLEVLFSPINGLFVYTPGFIFFVISFIFVLGKRNFNGYVGLFSFLLMIYISASWWAWSWGCSFSMRPMVDIIPILIVPFVAFIDWIYQRNKMVIITVFSSLFIYLGYANLTFSSKYNHCFEGDLWDWHEYHKVMRTANVFPFKNESFRNYFDYETIIPVRIRTQDGNYLQLTSEGKIVQMSTDLEVNRINLFYRIDMAEGKICLKSNALKYVTSDQDRNGFCIANRNEIGAWEKFIFHPRTNDFFSLENSEGKYLKFDDHSPHYLIGNVSDIDSAELFKFEYLPKKGLDK